MVFYDSRGNISDDTSYNEVYKYCHGWSELRRIMQVIETKFDIFSIPTLVYWNVVIDDKFFDEKSFGCDSNCNVVKL